MARIRTVKPELFKHEVLFDLEIETQLPIRLAWIGLFTIADREGRFKWRPRAIKAEIMPYDDVEFEEILLALVAAGFINRYMVGDTEYAEIPTFGDHQVINARESQSNLPSPDGATRFQNQQTSGYVYIAKAEGTEFIKVGYSSFHPSRRVRDLGTGSPVALTLKQFWEGRFKDESELHQALSKYRTRGEWFELNSHSQAIIDEHFTRAARVGHASSTESDEACVQPGYAHGEGKGREGKGMEGKGEGGARARDVPIIDSVERLKASLPILTRDLWRRSYPDEPWLEREIEAAFVFHSSEASGVPRTPGAWAKKIQTWLAIGWPKRGRDRPHAEADLSGIEWSGT